MGTDCNTLDCDLQEIGSCVRVQHFSHPGDINEGSGSLVGPIGNSNNNCAAQINAVADIVAEFRGSDMTTATPTVSPPTVPPLTAAPVRTPTKRPTRAPARRPTLVPTVPSSSTPASPVTIVPTMETTSINPYCGDGFCDMGEDCESCPMDCPSAVVSLAECGNGICEAGNGESYDTCPYDCRGDPTVPYKCGGRNGCRAECNQGSFQCTTKPVGNIQSCCGDQKCTAGESDSVCPVDCVNAASV
jgi:hypothetical protein